MLGLAVALAACGTTGRELRPAEPGATAPPRSTSTTTTFLEPSTTASVEPATFTASSPEISPAGELPVDVTCAGTERSPAVSWSAPPPEAAAIALVVTDLDDGGYVHWVVSGLDPAAGAIPTGSLPEGAVEGPSTADEARWIAPCPDEGVVHTYELTLHALAEPVDVSASGSADEAVAALEAASLARSAITATATG